MQVHLAARLVADTANGITAFQVESDLVESLKRLPTLIRRIARVLISVAERRAASPTPSTRVADPDPVDSAS